jgi:uncharacterized membrane protein (DUF106 family)
VAVIIFFIATIITTAIVSVWLTAVVSVAIKNQLMRRQQKQLHYWQARAKRAEDPSWRRP